MQKTEVQNRLSQEGGLPKPLNPRPGRLNKPKTPKPKPLNPRPGHLNKTKAPKPLNPRPGHLNKPKTPKPKPVTSGVKYLSNDAGGSSRE